MARIIRCKLHKSYRRLHLFSVGVVGIVLLLCWSGRKEAQEIQEVVELYEVSTSTGHCVVDSSKLPQSWRAPPDLRFVDSGKTWTSDEQDLANAAVEQGVKELVDFLDNIGQARVQNLGINAVNCIIDQAYSSSNMPKIQTMALGSAARTLKISVKPYVLPDTELKYSDCDHAYYMMELCAYAHYLAQHLPDDKELQEMRLELIKRTNAGIQDCGGSLQNLFGFDYKERFQNNEASTTTAKKYETRSVTLTDASTIPELTMPDGYQEYVAATWDYLSKYCWNWPYEDGYRARRGAYTMAYSATHAGYVPTGYGRHLQQVSDSPWLYQYIREHFYDALDFGELDLLAEFIHVLRYHGCTEDNDAQVRHGTRYLLHLYQNAGNSWMNHREAYEKKGRPQKDYDAIHRPWTGIGGVRRRAFEPMVPGSYGYAWRQALEVGKKKKKENEE